MHTSFIPYVITTGYDTPSLIDLYQFIVPRYADQWRNLGAALGMEEYQLEIISREYAQNPAACCRAMFSQRLIWMHHVLSIPLTWGKLNDAITLIKKSLASNDNSQVGMYRA